MDKKYFQFYQNSVLFTGRNYRLEELMSDKDYLHLPYPSLKTVPQPPPPLPTFASTTSRSLPSARKCSLRLPFPMISFISSSPGCSYDDRCRPIMKLGVGKGEGARHTYHAAVISHRHFTGPPIENINQTFLEPSVSRMLPRWNFGIDPTCTNSTYGDVYGYYYMLQ